MAFIALQKIIWHSAPEVDDKGRHLINAATGDPKLERVDIPAEGVVPKLVPLEIQKEWLERGWVREDPNMEMPERMEGPPNLLLPVNPNLVVRNPAPSKIGMIT